nr:unnamed protein product [Digitaria exilis]
MPTSTRRVSSSSSPAARSASPVAKRTSETTGAAMVKTRRPRPSQPWITGALEWSDSYMSTSSTSTTLNACSISSVRKKARLSIRSWKLRMRSTKSRRNVRSIRRALHTRSPYATRRTSTRASASGGRSGTMTILATSPAWFGPGSGGVSMELRRLPMLAALSASVRSPYLVTPATNMMIAGAVEYMFVVAVDVAGEEDLGDEAEQVAEPELVILDGERGDGVLAAEVEDEEGGPEDEEAHLGVPRPAVAELLLVLGEVAERVDGDVVGEEVRQPERHAKPPRGDALAQAAGEEEEDLKREAGEDQHADLPLPPYIPRMLQIHASPNYSIAHNLNEEEESPLDLAAGEIDKDELRKENEWGVPLRTMNNMEN